MPPDGDRRTPAAAEPASGLEAVYLANRPALLRFLRARGAGPRAEDLVQELWLRICAAPRGPIPDPLNYLFRAANNLMINAYRGETRHEARNDAWGDVTAEHEADAWGAIVARQEIALARQRLQAVGQRVLDIFFLFRAEGLTQREIAARYGLSVSAVEKDIQRGYRALAALKDETNG
ncbi:RNA polymerase sigma-70 factor (ECF subfamily) [Sphingomonas zeicaulis]|uniref:RNA polymerase sigma factor n=1 Tax=Sphingomonas zeicaulis TaxID=1632740 RepID=UPI003D22DD1E